MSEHCETNVSMLSCLTAVLLSATGLMMTRHHLRPSVCGLHVHAERWTRDTRSSLSWLSASESVGVVSGSGSVCPLQYSLATEDMVWREEGRTPRSVHADTSAPAPRKSTEAHIRGYVLLVYQDVRILYSTVLSSGSLI